MAGVPIPAATAGIPGMPETDLTNDHKALTEDQAARRYFRKFGRITELLTGVAGAMAKEGGISPLDAEVLADYVAAIASTFRALSMKYLIAGRLKSGARHLTIDYHESGFPVFQEIVTLANDTAQAGTHLASLPAAPALKDQMVKVILSERRAPVELQYALSQRLYFERLAKGGLFFAQMHPQARWLEDLPNGRRHFLVHWAVYDTQMNVPVVYLMEVEDSAARRPCRRTSARWPRCSRHLMAQSIGGLKLLTIAKGFDQDFEDAASEAPAAASSLGRCIRRPSPCKPGRSARCWRRRRPPKAKIGRWSGRRGTGERAGRGREGLVFWNRDAEVFKLDPVTGGPRLGATATGCLILPRRPFQVWPRKTHAGSARCGSMSWGPVGRVIPMQN
jgi:hypothetical protein